MVVNRIFVYLQ